MVTAPYPLLIILELGMGGEIESSCLNLNYRVFIAIWNKVNAFFGQKNLFLKLQFFFLKKKWDIYEYLKIFFKGQKFMS